MDLDRIITIAETVDPVVWIILGAIILGLIIAGIAIGWGLARWRRRRSFQKAFGPEFDRVREATGDEVSAEVELERRRDRVSQFNIRPLSPDERDHYTARWREVQAQFVDDPVAAARDATTLVEQLMQARGYPVGDFEQEAEDLSVDHPRVVENYRAARTLVEEDQRGERNTENLRQALVHYRQLFDHLLETEESAPESRPRPVGAS